MSFLSSMKDTVSLIKKNGKKTDGIKASVQKRKIFIGQSNILIETGDLIHRKMSNGGEETYEVIDPGFREHGGLPAHYQMDVKRVTPHADSLAKDSKNSKNVNTGTKTIFISHAAEDAILAKTIKTQIDNVFQEKIDVFVSSIPGKIKPGSDWLEKIVGNLIENSAFIVLVTPYSEKRPFVWFEIGFAWLRRQNKTCEIYAICAPPVEPGELAEPLRRLQATSLASEPQTKVFFDNLTKQFGMGNLSTLEFNKIANSLPSYPSQIRQIEDIDISDEAKELLIEASTDKNGQIFKMRHPRGSSITTNSKNMIPSQEVRIITKWEHALDELVENCFVEGRGHEGISFRITHQGYEYAETLKKDLHILDVLQDKSSVDGSASIEQNDLMFDPKTGTYTSKKNNHRYCGKCLKLTPPKEVELTEQDYGWRCNVCDKPYYNPNHSHKYDDRDKGTQDEDLLKI